MQTTKPLLILIAGPYRSGTDNEAVKIAANLARLEEVALPLFRAGHIPMVSEWVSLPLIRNAASATVPIESVEGDFLYPVANRLLSLCNAVLRIPGASRGADQDVALARQRGLPVYFSLDEVPPVD